MSKQPCVVTAVGPVCVCAFEALAGGEVGGWGRRAAVSTSTSGHFKTWQYL